MENKQIYGESCFWTVFGLPVVGFWHWTGRGWEVGLLAFDRSKGWGGPKVWSQSTVLQVLKELEVQFCRLYWVKTYSFTALLGETH